MGAAWAGRCRWRRLCGSEGRIARALDREQCRPVDNRVADRPVVWLAGGGIDLTRDRRQLAVGKAASPMLRRRQDVGVLPFGFGEVRIVLRKRLIVRMCPVLDLAQAGHAHLCNVLLSAPALPPSSSLGCR